jgi:hypothetical protein
MCGLPANLALKQSIRCCVPLDGAGLQQEMYVQTVGEARVQFPLEYREMRIGLGRAQRKTASLVCAPKTQF